MREYGVHYSLVMWVEAADEDAAVDAADGLISQMTQDDIIAQLEVEETEEAYSEDEEEAESADEEAYEEEQQS